MKTNYLDVQAFDYWSNNTKQDAWFIVFSLNAVIESLDCVLE